MFLTTLIRKFLGERASNRNFIARQAGGMYAIRVLYKAINFGIAILLARWLGQNDFGAYTLTWAWATLLAIPAAFGIVNLTNREISKAQIGSQWGQMRGYVTWSTRRLLFSSLAISGLFALAALWIYRNDPATRNAFLVAATLIPLTVWVRQLQSINDGLKNMVTGRVPDMLVQPVTFLGLAALFYWQFPAYFNAASVLGLYAVTTLVFSLGLGALLIGRVFPAEARAAKPEFQTSAWITSSFTFVIIATMSVADSRTSTLMLGALAAKSDVAIYGVLTRVVDLLTFVLMAFSMPVSRLALQYYQENKLIALQRILTRAVRVMALVGLPMGVLLIVFGNWYLLIFGPDYLPGYSALVLLILAEMINLVTGLSNFLLTMTQHEKVTAAIMFASLGLNLLVGFLLIPQFGLMGAAISEMSSVMFRNLALAYMTYRIMGVNTTILARMPKKQGEAAE